MRFRSQSLLPPLARRSPCRPRRQRFGEEPSRENSRTALLHPLRPYIPARTLLTGEYRRTDTKNRCSLFNGNLVIRTHTHTKLGKLGADNFLPMHLNKQLARSNETG